MSLYIDSDYARHVDLCSKCGEEIPFKDNSVRMNGDDIGTTPIYERWCRKCFRKWVRE